MMPDIGTVLAVVALALALIPLPDVLIGWFCMLLPAVRSPATRMGDLRDSLESTRRLLDRNPLERAEEGLFVPSSRSGHGTAWDTLDSKANSLEKLVKGGGWGRYSVAHLRWWMPDMRELNRAFASVTESLVKFNKDRFAPSRPAGATASTQRSKNVSTPDIDEPGHTNSRFNGPSSSIELAPLPLFEPTDENDRPRVTLPASDNYSPYRDSTGVGEAERRPLTGNAEGTPLSPTITLREDLYISATGQNEWGSLPADGAIENSRAEETRRMRADRPVDGAANEPRYGFGEGNGNARAPGPALPGQQGAPAIRRASV